MRELTTTSSDPVPGGDDLPSTDTAGHSTRKPPSRAHAHQPWLVMDRQTGEACGRIAPGCGHQVALATARVFFPDLHVYVVNEAYATHSQLQAARAAGELPVFGPRGATELLGTRLNLREPEPAHPVQKWAEGLRKHFKGAGGGR
jgi:hypothetical protein